MREHVEDTRPTASFISNVLRASNDEIEVVSAVCFSVVAVCF